MATKYFFLISSPQLSYKICLGTRTVCMLWPNLELCTGDGCKHWPRKGLVYPAKSFLSFLICEAKTVLPSKLFLFFYYVKLSYKICLATRTVCVRRMDLELCTGYGCKYWPRKELVHPAKSLPEFLDLWSKDCSSIKIVSFIVTLSWN